MTVLRLRGRGIGRRVAFIDGYEFPGSVRGRFGLKHESLSADEVRIVEAGARQWFRLAARHPKSRLAMASVVVDDLWHEMLLHTRDYAEFCDAAFGGFLHHTPESAMSPAALAGTYRLALRDEPDAPGRLPLLFRVDGELGIAGGRRYLADCGGRGQCYEMPGSLCLQHADGPGRKVGRDWDRNRAKENFPIDGGGGGCAACAGGG
jgi:hypothetical protein